MSDKPELKKKSGLRASWHWLFGGTGGAVLAVFISLSMAELTKQTEKQPNICIPFISRENNFNTQEEYEVHLAIEAKKMILIEKFGGKIDDIINEYVINNSVNGDDVKDDSDTKYNRRIFTRDEVLDYMAKVLKVSEISFKNSIDNFANGCSYFDKNLDFGDIRKLLEQDNITGEIGKFYPKKEELNAFVRGRLESRFSDLRTYSTNLLDSHVLKHEKGVYNFTGYYYNIAIELFRQKDSEIPVGPHKMYLSIDQDNHGNEAKVRVIVLSKDYRWKMNSTTKTETDNDDGPATLQNEIRSTKIRHYLKDVADIVVIGAASCEGDPSDEVRRARERAKQLAIWFYDEYPNLNTLNYPTLNSLSLGQYKNCPAENASNETEYVGTSWQRQIIIIGIVHKDGGLKLTEVLRETLASLPTIPKTVNYSRFRLKEGVYFEREEKLK